MAVFLKNSRFRLVNRKSWSSRLLFKSYRLHFSACHSAVFTVKQRYCFIFEIRASMKYTNPIIAGGVGRRGADSQEQTRMRPREGAGRTGSHTVECGFVGVVIGGGYVTRYARTDVTFRGFRLLTAWAKRGAEIMACAFIHGVVSLPPDVLFRRADRS